MTLPDAVRTALDDEPVLDRLALGGEDGLFVTPTRLLRYRSQGLFNDESVERFPYDAERISSSTGRRTAAISLEYVDGERTLSVPVDRLEAVLRPLLDGVLAVAGVIDDGEETLEAFRFDELTVVVTDRRLVEHVGGAVWDGEYEEVRFEDVTGIEVERGRLVTELVLGTEGRRSRIKIQNDRSRRFEDRVRGAILEHQGVDSIDELGGGTDDSEDDVDAFSLTGVDPLASARPTVDGPRTHTLDSEENDGPTTEPESIEGELEALASMIEKQEALLADQRRTIDRIRGTVTRDRGR